jgi:hypothetical protein
MPNGSVVQVTEDSILRGIADAEVSAAGTLVADPTPEDPLAYPMIKVDYAMVPKTFDTEEKIADVRRVLSYAVGDGQSILPSGYVNLPDAMRAKTQKIVEAIGVPVVATTTIARQVVTVPTTRSRITVPQTTVEPTASSTTTSTSTTTTEPAPITVPQPQLSDDFSGDRSSSGLMLGLGGLSGAFILGTAPWRKLGIRRKKVVS